MKHWGERLARPLFTMLLAFAAATGGVAQTQGEPPPLKPEEIEALVAPIALYPDSLLSQVLMASTYPLEIVQAARWVKANPNVKGDAAVKAVESQTWDVSVKSLVAFPQVLDPMNEKLDWTQKLGDAFLADQKAVLDAVQRLRAKADQSGNLKSNEQQKVIVEQAAPQQTVIKIEPTNPQVIYVPAYNPTVVYGAWGYPAYPPYYWPPSPLYYPGGALMTGFAWGVGIAAAGAIFGGCNWGRGDVNIDVNRATNIDRSFNRTNVGGGGQWQHDASHRKGVSYRDSASREKFGKDVPGADRRNDYRGRDAGPGDRGGRATGGRATAVAPVTGVAPVTAAGRAWPIAADRARATGAVRATAGVRACPIAAGPAQAAGTMHSMAWAAVPRHSATSTAAARATSRWRTAAGRALVRVRGRAPARGRLVRARARAVARAPAVVVRAPAVAVAAAAAGARETSTMRSISRKLCALRLAAFAAAVGLFVAWAPAVFAQQKTFDSPIAAMNAFGDAVATSDEDALKALLGADFRTFIPPVGAEGRYRFLAAWAKSHAIQLQGDAKALVAVGGDGWTLPIPIVKTAQGWRFDTRAGAEEMRLRRIGRNELAVMQVMLAIYDAEKEYARQRPQRRQRAPVRVQVRELARQAGRTVLADQGGRARQARSDRPSRPRARPAAAASRATTATATSSSPGRARTRPAARSTTSPGAG